MDIGKVSNAAEGGNIGFLSANWIDDDDGDMSNFLYNS